MSYKQNYASVIFIDLDGTLMVNPFEDAVWPVVLGELAQKSGESHEAIYRLIEAENDVRQQDANATPVSTMDWDDISETVAQRLGVTLEANCTELVRLHAATHSSVLDYAHEALGAIQSPERALVVATKGLAKYQRPVLDALGLTGYFTAILTPDVHNGLKKHRRFFGDWPERGRLAVMVGDRYYDDVLYPSGHGLKTIWKPPQGVIPGQLHAKDPITRARLYPYGDEQAMPATATIMSLRELPQTIAELEQRYA